MKLILPLIAIGSLLTPAFLIDFGPAKKHKQITAENTPVEIVYSETNDLLKNTSNNFLVKPIQQEPEREYFPEPHYYDEFEVVEESIQLVDKNELSIQRLNDHEHWTCDGSCGRHTPLVAIETIWYTYLETEVKTAETEGRVMDVEEPLFADYELTAYPNPFRDQLTIEIANYDGEPYTISIYDLSGRIVLVQDNLSDSRIDLSANSHWAPGIYVYRLVNNSQTNVKSGKIIKS